MRFRGSFLRFFLLVEREKELSSRFSCSSSYTYKLAEPPRAQAVTRHDSISIIKDLTLSEAGSVTVMVEEKIWDIRASHRDWNGRF